MRLWVPSRDTPLPARQQRTLSRRGVQIVDKAMRSLPGPPRPVYVGDTSPSRLFCRIIEYLLGQLRDVQEAPLPGPV